MPIFEPAYIFAASLALSGAELPKPVEPADLACLALNIYHEARGETPKGQAAVAHVTLNRAADPRYPPTVCEVVAQRNEKACQFTWYCQKDSVEAYDRQSFRRALRVALEVLEGRRADPTRGATHFITTSMRMPGWARRLTQTATIGGHRFFRY
jgi:spore germination cell wall hydrolase CwlJ-like protein